MKRNRRKNTGFTLVEVVISAAILAILIIPIASLTITTIKTSDSAEDKQKATQIGQQLLDEFKSFDDITLTHAAPANDTFTLLNGQVLEVNRDASNNIVQIDPIDATNNFNVKDEQGVEYTVRFELTRDTNATYNPSSGITVNSPSNYNQYIEFGNNTVDIYNAGASGGSHNVLSSDIKLNINNNMGIQMVDSGNLYPPTGFQVCNGTIGAKGYKIVVFIKNTMKTNDITLNIDQNDCTDKINIDVIKEDRSSKSVDITVKDANCKGDIIINNNQSTQGVNSIGDLYTAKVVVTRAGSDTLFEGESKKNILFHY